MMMRGWKLALVLIWIVPCIGQAQAAGMDKKEMAGASIERHSADLNAQQVFKKFKEISLNLKLRVFQQNRPNADVRSCDRISVCITSRQGSLLAPRQTT